MSDSSSSSSSGSNTYPIYTPQSTAALQIAQLAESYGSYTFNWAINNYAATTAMTDTAVANFLSTSQLGLTAAKQMIAQYNNTYVPEMGQLATLAGTYSSAARVAVNAGAAESASEQGSASGLNAAKMDLQSYGIDPSSGQYAELEESNRAAAGAAAAGAGVTAGEATQAAGRQLLGESIQVGEQLPGDTVNELNSAYQGISGAENAVLANAQTGANLLDASNPFLSTAMSLKYPNTGTTSSSHQSSQSQPATNTGGGNAATDPSSKGSNPNGSPASTNPTTGGNQQQPGSNNNPVDPTTGLPLAPNNAGDPSGLPSYGDTPTDAFGSPGTEANPYGAEFNDSLGSPGALPTSTGDTPTQGDNPFMPATPDTGSSTPFSDNSQGYGGGATTDTSAIPPPDYSSGSDNSGGDNTGYSNSYDTSGGDNSGGDTSGGDYSGGDNSGGGGGGYYGFQGGAFARGGPVAPRTAIPPQRGGFANAPHQILQRAVQQNMAKGGRIPMGVSPSHGQNVDDVPARLNAGEFVVPRDVAAWKGQEFFQNLIKKSRALSAGAPAKPSMKPPLPGQQQRPAIRPPGQ
jgi:hypothetical protein